MPSTTNVHAYAAGKPGGRLEPFEYELGPIGPHDVDIDVEHCGVCHSDLSMLDDAWGISEYPLVPGHEAIGTVRATGDLVTHLKLGDRVGLGWNSGFCTTCPSCLDGDQNMCETVASTIVGRHGAFADIVRAQATSVIKLPEGLDPITTGPLLCGGITVFNPLVQFNVSPTANVAVIGIGGLGHMALQFMRAWGCHVTAFTSSEAKRAEALKMGAHETLDSRSIDTSAPRFDFILSTVNVKLDWNAYVKTLKPRGRLHLVGVTLDPLNLELFPMISHQVSVSGSPIGAPNTITKMLHFAARHNIAPITEHFPMNKVNDAFERLRRGKAHYRLILDRVKKPLKNA